MPGPQAMSRMIFFLIGTLIFVSALSVQAQESRIKVEKELKPSAVHALIAVGSELRPEKDINNNFQQHSLANYALGAGYEQFIFLVEKAEFKESSGNASLKVDRLLEDYMLWAQYRAVRWNHLAPYFAGGVGAYKETIQTTVLTSTSTDISDEKMITGLAFGLSTDLPLLWLALEARVIFGDELDQNPTVGGLARIGLWF